MESHNADRLVCINEGTAVADSRVIAKTFAKRYDHVLRCIDEVIERLDRCKISITKNLIMGLIEKKVQNTIIPDRFDRCYEMERDVFTIVVMGFTVD